MDSALTAHAIAAYGPGDQGAINQFYEDSVKKAKLSQQFNAKPYHEYDPSAYIVHFHGPKFNDYLTYAENGTCTFGPLCKDGLDHAFCEYALEWVHFVQDEEIAQQVQVGCNMLMRERQTSSSASELTGSDMLAIAAQ